ncbi:MAG: NAD-dependent epimerase/dehydratase family protein [Alphaproteobacteria bacterium]|nr:MAG: NAD-dependent epimerase/dehydratase family protein [Alphaproteobacteria bacterium]
MKIIITGGAGFLGQRLTKCLLNHKTAVNSRGQEERIDQIVLFDVVPGRDFQDHRVQYVFGDISDKQQVTRLIDEDTDSIFHLAAVVSAHAEEDFNLGYRINLDGTRHVLEAARALSHAPKVVFTSSIATYGGVLPDIVTDETAQLPQTSYGASKVIGELLVQDYSRKGFIDGRALRLPTISIRTGLPNKAASTWASSIIREPLCGQDAICPVQPETPMTCMSPSKVIDALIHAHNLPVASFTERRSILLTGLSVTAADMAKAVERHKGNRDIGRIRWQPDEGIQKIVDGWPKETRSRRAELLGFPKDESLDEMVHAFIEEDMDDQVRLYEKTGTEEL